MISSDLVVRYFYVYLKTITITRLLQGSEDHTTRGRGKVQGRVQRFKTWGASLQESSVCVSADTLIYLRDSEGDRTS